MRAETKLSLFCLSTLSVVLMLCLAGCSESGGHLSSPSEISAADRPPRDSTPVVLAATAPETEVVKNEKALLDFSNASLGYICAKSFVAPTLVKVLVEVSGTQYQYSIEGDDFIVIPLSCGDGTYSVSLWENVFQDQYAAIFSQDIQVSIQDKFLPFLYPNQYVEFNAANKAIELSGELARSANGEVKAIEDIYDYVVSNITYDFDKAATVSGNYLPSIDETLESGKGICFDYAVLTAAMLRAQQVPTKLVVGYAGSAYHAWIEAYSAEEGWIKKEIHFNGTDYVLMDPTFASTAKGSVSKTSVVGDGSNYNPRFYY